jgi:hypothetical protein
VTFFWEEDDIRRFLDLQMSSAVMEKREVRQMLRAIARSGKFFEWSFSQREQVTLRDGVSGGQQNWATVSFDCQYTKCILTLKTKADFYDTTKMMPG